MILVDRLLMGGIRFVLDKVATAAEAELNDDSVLREQLLEAQMALETGDMSEEEFATIEADLFERIRAIKERQRAQVSEPSIASGEYRVVGAEASVVSDEGDFER